MGLNIRENGISLQGTDVEKGYKYGLMALSTKGGGWTTKLMEKVD